MLWTVLAVVLILNGFFHNDAWEIASAVLFGALGFRRAVMQWEKPRALMNFGVIVLAIGLALWQMNRGDAKKEKERESERAPAVAQERVAEPSPVREEPTAMTPQKQYIEAERTPVMVERLRLDSKEPFSVTTSSTSEEFIKPANCMVQIAPGFSNNPEESEGAKYSIEYQSAGRTFWERYDWHVQYGEEALIWDELKLRVVAEDRKPVVAVENYCKRAGETAWRKLDFGGRVSNGHIQDGANSARVKIGDDMCFVRLKFRTDDIDAGEIEVTGTVGSGKEIYVVYNALYLPRGFSDFYVTVKRGMVRDGMEFALECPGYH
jgi:hypothetical protein